MKKVKLLIFVLAICVSVFLSGCEKTDKIEGDKSETVKAVSEKQESETQKKEEEPTAEAKKSEEKTADKPVEKQEAKPADEAEKSKSVKAESEKTATAKAELEKKETLKTELEKAEPTVPAQKYKDGTFTGSAKGYVDNITVSVVLKADTIKSISIVSHKEDSPYIDDAKAVIGKILVAQSADVDAVAGATYSSNGIKGAVKAALAGAQN